MTPSNWPRPSRVVWASRRAITLRYSASAFSASKSLWIGGFEWPLAHKDRTPVALSSPIIKRQTTLTTGPPRRRSCTTFVPGIVAASGISVTAARQCRFRRRSLKAVHLGLRFDWHRVMRVRRESKAYHPQEQQFHFLYNVNNPNIKSPTQHFNHKLSPFRKRNLPGKNRRFVDLRRGQIRNAPIRPHRQVFIGPARYSRRSFAYYSSSRSGSPT
jgi:hypothetical protein